MRLVLLYVLLYKKVKMKTEHPQACARARILADIHGCSDTIYYLRLGKYNDILVIFGSCRFGQVRARFRRDTRQSQNISIRRKKKNLSLSCSLNHYWELGSTITCIYYNFMKAAKILHEKIGFMLCRELLYR